MNSDLAPPVRRREILLLAAVLSAVKLILLWADPTVRFFLGDSASYLHSALTGWIPPDRSFLYGILLRGSAIAAHSMLATALLQSLFGVATACLIYGIARASFGVSHLVASLVALALSLEPAQLFYERMLMAESAGTLAFVAMLACGFAYLRKPHWMWPLLWALAGILAVALRLSLLPVTLGFALLPIAVAWISRVTPPNRLHRVAHLCLAVVATGTAHSTYQHVYGRLTESRADYINDSGYFRLGLVAPLVTREQVIRVGLPADLLDRVGPSLHDPATREAQIWSDTGLAAQIRNAAGAEGNRAARKLAAQALRADPLGLLRLSLFTLGSYFDAPTVQQRLNDDLGNRAADDDLVEKLQRCCAYQASGIETLRNPMLRYFAASAGWLTVCYFGTVPLALWLMVLLWRRQRAAAMLLLLAALGQVAALILFSHIVSFRYLHPLPPLLLLSAGVLLDTLIRRRAAPPDGGGDKSTSAN